MRVSATTGTGFLLSLLFALASSAQAQPSSARQTGLPLKPDRKFELTTDEGTWMSLSVSPDDGTILFDLLGELYRIPARGGPAQLLLGGMAFDSQPIYSPDGEWIAFVSDRSGNENLWKMRSDGTALTQLTFDTNNTAYASPAWSPDGRTLYVNRSRPWVQPYEIWSYPAAGGDGVRLTNADAAGMPTQSSVHQLGAAPSPDGKYLYASQRQGYFESNVKMPVWSVVRRTLATGTEDIVINAPGSAMTPLVSPDGRSLAYATRFDSRTGLRLRDLETGADRWLSYPIDRDDQEAVYPSRGTVPRYAFSKDGKFLYLAHGGKIRRLDMASGAQAVIPFEARVTLDIGPAQRVRQRDETGPVRTRVVQAPKLSPDGTRVAYSALGRLYIKDVAGGNPRLVADGERGEYQPNWSPDGLWLTYVRWDAHRSGHIWKARADGRGKPRQLTNAPSFYTEPTFSKDGSTIYAIRSSDYERMHLQTEVMATRTSDIVALSSNGGAVRLVGHATGAQSLGWSDDEQRIQFYSGKGLQTLDVTGGGDMRIVATIRGPGPWDPTSAQDARISPQGSWALAQSARQLYLFELPPEESVATVDLTSSDHRMTRLTDSGVDSFAWAENGKTITWTLGAKLFRLPLSAVTFGRAPATGPNPNTAHAQVVDMAVEVPRDVARGAILLRGATVITMEQDAVIKDGDVLVVDSRIAGVGPRGTLAVPAGAEIRDVTGKFILPGYVDTHAHWYEVRQKLLDLENWSFLSNLAYGVTAGLDPQTFTSDIFAYQDMLDAGLMTGLRAYSAGPGLYTDNPLDNESDALKLVKRNSEFYRTRNLKSYQIGNRRKRQLLLSATHALGVMPTVESANDTKLALTLVIDGYASVEHALPITPLYKDVIELFAQVRPGHTLTNMISSGGPQGEDWFFIHQPPHDDPKIARFMPHYINDERSQRRTWYREEDQIFPKLSAEALKMYRRGGLIGVGSHAEFQGLAYHWEMQTLAAGGWSPREILHAATIGGAEIIGFPDEIGSIAPGKYADLQILDADPLSDIRNSLSIRQVMKNGRLYDASSLDETWPRERQLKPLWFWRDQPPAKSEQ